MLYIFENLNKIDSLFFKSKQSLLSEQRFEKIKRLKSSKAKNASIAVYLLLRLGLLQKYGINEAAMFKFGKHKKPFLKDYPHIFFSLSHSDNVVACAISDSVIGVDVQIISPIEKKLAKRVLTESEYLEFEKSKVPDDYFCKVWTVKESYLKKTGDGITKELREISADSISGVRIIRGADYYCSVCSDKVCGDSRSNSIGVDNSDIKDCKINVKYVGRDDFEQLCFGQTD